MAGATIDLQMAIDPYLSTYRRLIVCNVDQTSGQADKRFPEPLVPRAAVNL
jgi:hypothetical protein